MEVEVAGYREKKWTRKQAKSFVKVQPCMCENWLVAWSFFPLILHMPHILALLGVLMLVKQMRKECDVSHGNFTHIWADLAANFPFYYSMHTVRCTVVLGWPCVFLCLPYANVGLNTMCVLVE